MGKAVSYLLCMWCGCARLAARVSAEANSWSRSGQSLIIVSAGDVDSDVRNVATDAM